MDSYHKWTIKKALSVDGKRNDNGAFNREVLQISTYVCKQVHKTAIYIGSFWAMGTTILLLAILMIYVFQNKSKEMADIHYNTG